MKITEINEDTNRSRFTLPNKLDKLPADSLRKDKFNNLIQSAMRVRYVTFPSKYFLILKNGTSRESVTRDDGDTSVDQRGKQPMHIPLGAIFFSLSKKKSKSEF